MHTAAFADPSSAIDEELAADVLKLAERDAEGVEQMLDRLEQALLNTMPINCDPQVEEEFRKRWLPEDALVGRASSPRELGDLLAAVDQRWRLDAILVVRDLVDGI
jgi:hypothetical protein